MKKATTATKKPAAKATGADRPTSAKTTTTGTKTTSTTKSTTTKPATSRPTTATTKATTVPSTPKPPATPKTPKPPATPKAPTTPKATTKPPATPKAPITPKTPKPATSRPSTAKPTTAGTTAAKPAAAKRPATATAASATTKTTTASKPATARPATATTAKTSATTKTTTKPSATTTKSATATSAKAVAGKTTSAAKPANGVVSPRENAAGDVSSRSAAPSKVSPRPATGSTSARPSTSAPTLAKSTSGSKSARPTTASAAPAKKATTPRGDATATGVPRADVPLKSPRKSPRHNVASLSRTSTAPELPIVDPTRQHLTAGSRSVSVGGLQSNMTRAAPAGRRKPTVNPVKSRKDTPIRDAPPREGGRAAANFLNGMGLLASVGGEGQEFGQIQLRKVSEDKPKPLLIRVKGRRNVTARAVETNTKSLNKGDAFVLIDPATRTVFEWRGSAANKMEIAKAMDIAGRVKNKEFGGRADIFVLEDGKTDQNPKFWELMGGKGNIAPAENAGEDEDEDKIVRQDYLFGVVEKTAGKPELHQIAKHKFNKEMLQSGQVYLLDCLTELYMWVGKGCVNSHRTLVGAKAQEALAAVKVRPKWVGITRVIEGAEPEIFKEKFCDWPSTLPITMAAVPKGNVAAKITVKFDVATMFVSPKREDRNIDDGSGKVEIWRVKDHAKEPIDPNMYGQFFDSESYVILYKYMVKNREHFIIYFWQGKKSSINEKGSSALLTIDLDDSIGGNATQIRVVQNKEPKHFMKLFKGFVIVHKACDAEDGASAVHETALYQIRGCNKVEGVGCDVRAVQLDTLNAKHLNTNDIFLLNTPEKQFIWMGANSCKFLVVSQESLEQLANTIKGSREQVFIREGEEPSEFWEYMGGEGDYYKTAWKWMPRLFHCSSASGAFKVEEVLEWDQEDLDPGHLNILDTSGDVFLWTGQRAVNLDDEKKQAMQAALDYVKLHPTRLELQLPTPDNILAVLALKEPYDFRAVFTGWDSCKAKTNGENDVLRVADLLKDLTRNYTLAELQNAPKMLDASRLESYLSTEEFASVFKLDKEAFAAQPLWKQEQQKKSVGLY